MTDRQTDGQTDRRTEFSSQYRVCITCSAVNITASRHVQVWRPPCQQVKSSQLLRYSSSSSSSSSIFFGTRPPWVFSSCAVLPLINRSSLYLLTLLPLKSRLHRGITYNIIITLTHSHPTPRSCDCVSIASRAAVCGQHARRWSNVTDISRPPASIILILTHRLAETWSSCRSFLYSRRSGELIKVLLISAATVKFQGL